MATFRNSIRLAGLFLLFPVLYLYLARRKKWIIIPFCLLSFGILGCFKHYYTKDVHHGADSALIERLRTSNKLFVAHFKDSLMLLNNLRLDGDNLVAINQSPDQDLKKQLDTANLRKRTYNPKTQATVPMQVHLYIDKPASHCIGEATNTSTIQLKDIRQIDIHEEDRSSTNTSTVFSILGITVAGLSIAFVILFLISCNCPQVFVDEAGGQVFKGGLYSGAILSSAERTDYMVLDQFSADTRLARMRINNVRGEAQYINQIRLLAVSHPKNSNVLVDRKGRVFRFDNPVAPLEAYCGSGKNIRQEILANDGNFAFFDERKPNQASSILLRFPSSMAGKKARLIIHGQNTAWAGYLNQQFMGYFGKYYDRWQSQQELKEPTVLNDWMLKQSLPIKIMLKQANGAWQMTDYLPLAGNTAMRKFIVELDLPHTTAATLDIRLETVYNFWQIDCLSLDTTEQTGISHHWIDPKFSSQDSLFNAAMKLKKIDREYFKLEGEQSLPLEFTLPDPAEGNQSFFLAGTGYYHQPAASQNKPDFPQLISFQKAGAFQSFSLKESEKMERNIVVSHRH